MSFRDLPIVDPPSVNTERSELAFLTVLNRRSGFICKPDKPDYGCDFDVELIVDGRGASNRRFGIQLKSVEQLPLLADGRTISYAFETSRLGYLLNRPAGEGLIVIYDVASGQLYYEFAVNLFSRLMLERGSDDWQARDKVNIHISTNNVLNVAAATTIHTHFRKRFEKVAEQLGTSLRVHDRNNDTYFDLNDTAEIKDLLSKYGLRFLQEHEIDSCFWLLRKLPAQEIDRDPHLMFLSAIAYAEMGRRYDSENYIRRLYKRNQVPEAQEKMLRFCHLKNQMLLDQIDLPEFLTGIHAIRDEEINPRNILLIELNIIYYEQISVKFYHALPIGILDRIRAVFAQLPEMAFDHRSRQLVEINNAENLAKYINYNRLSFFNDLAIRRAFHSFGPSLRLEEKRQEIQTLENEFSAILLGIYEDARSRGDHLIQAQALLVRSRYLLSKEIDLCSQWPLLKNLRFHDQKAYLYNINLILDGFNHFNQVGYLELAQQALQIGIDLILFGRNVYRYKDGYDLEDLSAYKKKFAEEHELELIDLQYPILIKRIKKINHTDEGYLSETKDLDDQQLKGMAAAMVRAASLPTHCLPNVLSELQNCRLFYQRAKPGMELIPYDRRYDLRTLYKTPVRFVIYNKKTDLRSVPSSNVGELLASWGL